MLTATHIAYFFTALNFFITKHHNLVSKVNIPGWSWACCDQTLWIGYQIRLAVCQSKCLGVKKLNWPCLRTTFGDQTFREALIKCSSDGVLSWSLSFFCQLCVPLIVWKNQVNEKLAVQMHYKNHGIQCMIIMFAAHTWWMEEKILSIRLHQDLLLLGNVATYATSSRMSCNVVKIQNIIEKLDCGSVRG